MEKNLWAAKSKPAKQSLRSIVAAVEAEAAEAVVLAAAVEAAEVDTKKASLEFQYFFNPNSRLVASFLVVCR